MFMDSSSEENQERLILTTCTGLTEILVGKIRFPWVSRLAVKIWWLPSATAGDACVFVINILPKVPCREGKEGFSLQGWVLPVRNNPPLHPSSGGDFHA